MLFLALKGYGDLTILLYFLMRIKTRQNLIVRRGLYDLAYKYVGNKHNIIPLNTVDNTLSIYALRDLNFSSLCKAIIAYFELKKVIKKYGGPILIDTKSIRSMLFFHYSKIIYLPNAKTIYEAYEIFFKLPKTTFKKNNVGSKCIIFPLGSKPSKNLTENELLKVLIFNSIDHNNSIVCIHQSHLKFLKNFKQLRTIYYNSIDELDELIQNHHIVMSVDTFQLHLSVLLGKITIPVGSINSYFMPPNTYISIQDKRII